MPTNSELACLSGQTGSGRPTAKTTRLYQCGSGGALLGLAPTNVLVRKVERHEDTIRVENIVAEWPGADKSEARVKGASRSKSIHSAGFQAEVLVGTGPRLGNHMRDQASRYSAAAMFRRRVH
jgi:hypothetical protein